MAKSTDQERKEGRGGRQLEHYKGKITGLHIVKKELGLYMLENHHECKKALLWFRSLSRSIVPGKEVCDSICPAPQQPFAGPLSMLCYPLGPIRVFSGRGIVKWLTDKVAGSLTSRMRVTKEGHLSHVSKSVGRDEIRIFASLFKSDHRCSISQA